MKSKMTTVSVFLGRGQCLMDPRCHATGYLLGPEVTGSPLRRLSREVIWPGL